MGSHIFHRPLRSVVRPRWFVLWIALVLAVPSLAGAAVGPQPEGPLTLTVFPTSASLGEEITLIVRNTSNRLLHLPNTAPFLILGLEGDVVFSPVAALMIVPLPAGEEGRWTWDQRDNDGQQAPAGVYRVAVTFLDGNERAEVSTDLSIQSGVRQDLIARLTVTPNPAALGSMVEFRLTNISDTQVVLANPLPFTVFDAGGNAVYAPITIQILRVLPPGESITTLWDQWGDQSTQVPPGNYRVSAVYFDADNVRHELSVPLTILESRGAADEVEVGVTPDPAPLGSPVEFRLTNNSQGTIGHTSPAPFRVFDPEGNLVLVASFLESFVILLPGQSSTFEWDQRDAEGEQVQAGTYRVVSEFTDSAGSRQEVFADFSIAEGTQPPEPVRITVIPEPAPLGSPVTFHVDNASDATITLPSPSRFQVFDAGGDSIFEPSTTEGISRLEPGETTSFRWEQRDREGNQVPPGRYEVQVGYAFEGQSEETLHIARASFRIIPASERHLLDFPWLEEGRELSSFLFLSNPGSSQTRVDVFVNALGLRLSVEPISLELPPHTRMIESFSRFWERFGLPEEPPPPYAHIWTLSEEAIDGAVILFRFADSLQMSYIPAFREGKIDLRFVHAVENESFSTWIAISNPSDIATASVSAEVWDDRGWVAEFGDVLQLQASQSFVGPLQFSPELHSALDALLPANSTGPRGAALRLTADSPINGFLLLVGPTGLVAVLPQ